MISADAPLSQLVVVDAGFKPAVHLPDDFDKDEQNAQLIRTYIPTTQSISFLAEVARSLNPVSNERARMLTGTFGTGKSDLLLMLCNYFLRPVDDPVMQPFYEKLRRLNEAQYTTIYQQRVNKKPFLVVLLQANAVTPFPGFVLHGLEQALRKAGLEEFMLPTRYAAAAQKISEWQREGHPVLQRFVAALRDNEAKELTTLLRELGGPGADLAFPAFLRAFRTATGTAFDIYSYNRPEETYKRVAQALRERGSHSGILVVCDEFTEVLRRLARASDQQAAEVEAEALGVQDLANTSISSGQNQLYFVISSLESFASSSNESTSGSGSKTVEKIGGRFKPFELALQDSAELIRGAIRRLTDAAVLPNRQRDELVELGRTLWRQSSKQWVTEMVVDGCFPLHPLVTFSLPLINRHVAQNNRTMFLFLKDKEGLSGFLEQQRLSSLYSDWSTLLTLDVLFDYFEKSIVVRRSDVIESYNHSVQLLRRVTVDTALAQRVLKTVAFCEVIEPALSPNRVLLRQALNLPPSAEAELLQALHLLEQIEAIYPPSDIEGEASGAYSLPMAGRVSSVNLRQRVLRKAREMQTSISSLQSAHPPEAIKADEYNRRRGGWRELTAKYVSLGDLSNAGRLKDDLSAARDGLLWYVITGSESERSDAQSRARELTRQHSKLVVAVPVVPLTVLEALKNYQALQTIRSDTTLDSAAKTYLQDAGLVGKGFHSALTTSIVRLGEQKQWEWFREGASQPNITNAAQAQDLASRVMAAVYLHTPEHQLSQHFKAEGYTPNLMRALTTVLKDEPRISKNGNKEETVIRTGLAGLGLVKLVRTEGAFEVYSLTEPGSGVFNSQKIWQLYTSHLTSKKGWPKLVEALRREPYGLYDSLIAAFTAVFCTFHADGIEITSDSGHVVLDEKVLKSLVDNPQLYDVRFQPLTELEKQWLRGVVAAVAKRQAEGVSGHGRTLRSRVAAQVKSWLSGLRLPLFVEKLDVAQLAVLAPDTAEPIIRAFHILFQASRNEEAIASTLLKDVPEVLFDAKYSEWTNEQVAELLARWTETCRFAERLPGVLEQHAVNAVAAAFGCQAAEAERRWSEIYGWRQHRRVVHNRVEDLPSYARTFFRLANQPTSTIRESLLEEFSRTIIGINTPYQIWPTLEHLDRLVKEVKKARDEVDARWRTLANAEDVWHDGLASAALGRPVSGVDAERAAKYLREWATSVAWPRSAPALRPAELQRLYPSQNLQGCTDICAVLSRIEYQADDWKRDLGDALPQQFGVVGWTKIEVERAVARLGVALKQAANLDALLRQHVMSSVLKLFVRSAQEDTPPGELLRQWCDAHPIPADNDLDEDAQVVLGQIGSSANPETVLLISLPRALPSIAQSYQQWEAYSGFEGYLTVVSAAVDAVDRYQPLTAAEMSWLTGIVTEGLRRPLTRLPREKSKLAQVVVSHLHDWLSEQQLPEFVVTLSAAELQELFPSSSRAQLQAVQLLLATREKLRDEAAAFVLHALPAALCAEEPGLSDEVVRRLLADLSAACQQIRGLNDALLQRLLRAIAPIFGVEAHSEGAGELLSKLRVWRQSYVLLGDADISDDASIVSELLAAPNDDPLKLLLTTLPSKLREVRAPYGSWRSWGQHTTYVQSLKDAADEIAKVGEVKDATPEARQMWDELKYKIAGLSRDEQRWVIKAFSEEFRV